tara:strand:- start:161 stop:508 length:348 start_codon:yes stop_codon:yes gene_type:complete
MRINEIITKKSGAGTVTTVGGNEISRSTPKIGGSQTTQYADGSIKNTFNTNVGGVDISNTKVNGIRTNTDLGSGTMSMKTSNTANNKYNVDKLSYNMGGGAGTLVAKPGKISIRK